MQSPDSPHENRLGIFVESTSTDFPPIPDISMCSEAMETSAPASSANFNAAAESAQRGDEEFEALSLDTPVDNKAHAIALCCELLDTGASTLPLRTP